MKNFVLTLVLTLGVLFGFAPMPCFAGQSVRATRLIVSADPIQPVGDYLVFGTTQRPLLNLRFTSVGESIAITDFVIEDSMIEGDFSHLGLASNFALYDQYGVRIGAYIGFANLVTNPLRMPVHLNAPLLVSRNNSVTVRIMADMPQYGANSFAHKSVHTFGVGEKGFVALNAQTNAIVPVAFGLSPVSQKFTVVRSVAGFSSQPTGPVQNRVLSTFDHLADVVISADTAGPVVVTDITLTFSGNFPFSEDYFAKHTFLTLLGQQIDVGEPFAYRTRDGRWGVCFRFKTPIVVSARTQAAFGLVMNTQVAPWPLESRSISIDLVDRDDIGYLDSLDPSTAATLCLPLGVAPKHIATLTYSSGQ